MKIISFPPWKTVIIILGRNVILLYGNTATYSCINQVVIMKVSILQYKANPVYEFVTMKMGNHPTHDASF